MANPDFYYVNQFRSYPFELIKASNWYYLLIEASITVLGSRYVNYPTLKLVNCSIQTNNIVTRWEAYDIEDAETVIDTLTITIPTNLAYGSVIKINQGFIGGSITVGDLSLFSQISETELSMINTRHPTLLTTRISYLRDYVISSISAINSDRNRIGFDAASGISPDYGITNDDGSYSKYWYAEPSTLGTTIGTVTIKEGINCQLSVSDTNGIIITPVNDKKRTNSIDVTLGSCYNGTQFLEEQKPVLNGVDLDRFSGALRTTNFIKAVNNAIGPNITITGEHVKIVASQNSHSLTLETS